MKRVQHDNEIVKVADVVTDDIRFQVRQALQPEHIERNLEQLRKGADGTGRFRVKPQLWQRDDGKYLIVDGWHRFHAAIQSGYSQIEVDLLACSEHEALIIAMRANLTHGLGLKPEERMEACRRTIEAMTKPDRTQPSDGLVAKVLGVSATAIKQYKEKLIATGKLPQATKVFGKDGRPQKAKKKPSSTKPKPTSGPEPEPAIKITNKNAEFETPDGSTGKPSPDHHKELDLLREVVKHLKGVDAASWKDQAQRDELKKLVDDLVAWGGSILKQLDVLKKQCA